jgi:hypothetical protein
MGLLDDAIREHLDLKRRSGGDPAEIERLEREALGRVRREPTASVGTSAAPVQEAAPEYTDDRGDDLSEVPRAEIVGTPTERPPKRRGFLHRRASSSAAPDPPGDLEDDQPDLEHEDPELDGHEPLDRAELAPVDDDLEPEPPPLALAGQHGEDARAGANESIKPASPMDDATVEHEAADGFDDEYRAFEEEPDVTDEDDVLEETPEFLQDTPDHDRLWFEQRPPKDFDFDE